MVSYKSIDIIGGGIIGLTLATELLRLIQKRGGSAKVHLFERRGQVGIENTEKSFEGVRTYWLTPEEIRFYLHSIHAFKDLTAHFRSEGDLPSKNTGTQMSARYRQKGYHYFLSENDFCQVSKLQDLFADAGVPLELYSKDEAQTIPWIQTNFDLYSAIPKNLSSAKPNLWDCTEVSMPGAGWGIMPTHLMRGRLSASPVPRGL
jgi:glycine/D-amino acid oxidase-like deaminating enzyme